MVRRRLEAPLVENALSLATPFLAFVPAEELHVSGVLAVVVCGLVLGHQSPVLPSSAARLQSRAVWRLIDLLLEGLVLRLFGQQLPVVLSGLAEQLSALARSRQNAGRERRRTPDLRPDARETPSAAFARLRHEMIAAERQELLRWGDGGRIDDDSRRELEHQLDYEEGLLD